MMTNDTFGLPARTAEKYTATSSAFFMPVNKEGVVNRCIVKYCDSLTSMQLHFARGGPRDGLASLITRDWIQWNGSFFQSGPPHPLHI